MHKPKSQGQCYLGRIVGPGLGQLMPKWRLTQSCPLHKITAQTVVSDDWQAKLLAASGLCLAQGGLTLTAVGLKKKPRKTLLAAARSVRKPFHDRRLMHHPAVGRCSDGRRVTPLPPVQWDSSSY